ncbi:MAG: hypothetical protein ACYDAE_10410, partial [Steroidobacteraceae bacterium]
LVHALFGDRPAFGLVLGGASMVIGGLCTLRVAEPRAAEAASPPGLGEPVPFSERPRTAGGPAATDGQ